MKLFEFGVDSIIVGDRDSTALAMVDRCQVHGPPNVRFEAGARRIRWPGWHVTHVMTTGDIFRPRGLSVGAIWVGGIMPTDIASWDDIMLALHLEPREVMFTEGRV